MRIRRSSRERRGATLVESAFVMPVVLMLVIGLIVGGLGVFRYQELAHVTRQVARYASLHGARYAVDNPNAAVVDLAALKAYAATQADTIDTSKWTITVTMTVFAPGATSSDTTPPATSTVNWDDTTNNQNHSPYSSWTNTATNNATTASNLVTVTISYPWMPEAYLVGPITLSSTSVMAMSH